MAECALDIATYTPVEVNDHQSQSVICPTALTSPAVVPESSESPTPTSIVHSSRPFPSTSASAWTQNAPSDSKGCTCQQSVLVSADPVIEVTLAPVAASPTPESESELPQDNDLQPSLAVKRSARTSTTSASSSDSGSGSASISTLSSLHTPATTLSSTSAPLCVTFAPLPTIEPRTRNSNRPLGIAARSQMLRQRRMRCQDGPSYYAYDEDQVNSMPDEERRPGFAEKDSSKDDKRTRGTVEQDPFVALRKRVGGATKVILRRLSHGKLRRSVSDSVESKQSQIRPAGKKTFSWRGHRRASTVGASESSEMDGHGSDDSDSDNDLDGPWQRRKNEDPMTKTIMEGSDNGHDIDQFIVAYDAVLEEEEDLELARVHDEIRTTVEVRVAKAVEDEDGLEK